MYICIKIIIATLCNKSYVINSYWADGHEFKTFMLDRKKTKKELLNK